MARPSRIARGSRAATRARPVRAGAIPASTPPARAIRARPTCARPGALVVALLALLAASPDAASAHSRSVSYSNVVLDDAGARVHLRVSLLELSRLGIPLPLGAGADTAGPEAAAVGDYLSRHFEVARGGAPCVVEGEPRTRTAEGGWLVSSWSVRCGASGATEIRTRILLAEAPSHLHFARFTRRDPASGAERIVERVLSDAEPTWTLPDGEALDAASAPDAAATSFGGYLALGIEHILTGWDHLAFVLALVLLARTLGEVARLVTGFTVAHSVTLALAVLGWVEPDTVSVEAVIGYSVALIAAENAWLLAGRGRAISLGATLGTVALTGLAFAGIGRLPELTLAGLALFTACHFLLLERARDPGGLRVLIAFAFGLVHGFGFAGVMAEMTLPPDRLAVALLGFNLGVELGQLAVIALLWPLLVWLRRIADGAPHRLVAEIASAGVCGVGLYWFVTRSFGAGGA